MNKIKDLVISLLWLLLIIVGSVGFIALIRLLNEMTFGVIVGVILFFFLWYIVHQERKSDGN